MKSSLFDHNFGLGNENEFDANSALAELDKGLRSGKIGEQSEAIVRFPVFFEKYPFPILINSAFLKLADVFRNGSNFLRLWILRVCQQSEGHLEKIINTEEFIRRIFSVIHSNDSVARALTLRTLGASAGIISERKQVHHSIRVALDSNDRVEVLAAIYAASCFAKKSKTFGTTMCTKISSMVQRLSTPIDLKLQLIPIFQHMHHEVSTVSMVRKLCQELLISYPSEEFVITILHTLTLLAAATISDLTEQVSFLLKNLSDSRPLVKLNVLRDLKYLGQKGSHLWEASHISLLIEEILSQYLDEIDSKEPDNYEPQIIHATLDAVNAVTSSAAIVSLFLSSDSSLWKLLESSIKSSDKGISLKGIQIATYIAVNWKSEIVFEPDSNLVDLATEGAEQLLKDLCNEELYDKNEWNSEKEANFTGSLKKCLSYGVLLCKSNNSKCFWFCQNILDLLKIEKLSTSTRYILCESIGSVGSFNHEAVQKILPDIINILNSLTDEQIKSESNTVEILVVVILQAHQGFSIGPQSIDIINRIIGLSNLWISYKIARSSFRYGQPEMAQEAIKDCSNNVSSEHYFYWLSALSSIAEAETVLVDSIKIPSLNKRLYFASKNYFQATTYLKNTGNYMTSLNFQIEFVKLRAEMFVAFINFSNACTSLYIASSSSIASHIATTNRDELIKSGKAVTQLRKVMRDFQGLSEMYGRLYQTAFDADNSSLLNIQILQKMCLLVARAIEKVAVPKDHPSFTYDDQQFNFCLGNENYKEFGNSWVLIKSCAAAAKVVENLKEFVPQRLTTQHVECLREAIRILCETPLSFPRYFFQSLQITKVKMAVSPQPRIPGENISISVGNNFALKVEGVIQQSGIKRSPNSNKNRRPKAIRITVVSTSTSSRNSHIMDHKAANQEPITVVKDVVPHRDFYSAQFLLALLPGISNISVDTSLVDYEGRYWITGSRGTLSIKVYEDQTTSSSSKSTMPQNIGSSRQNISAPRI